MTTNRGKNHFLENLKAGYPSFWLLAAFVVLVFFTGGSSRSDVVSLAILYPISFVLLGIGMWNVKISQIRSNRGLVALLVGLTTLFFIYLIPLPTEMSRFLSGGNINDEVFSAASLDVSWRPLAADPVAALNALLGLSVPLTAVFLGVQIGPRNRVLLLHLLISLIAISGVIGLIQSVSSTESSLYFYDVTNRGSAVGFFANRNHHAAVLACLFPMLAVYASSSIRDHEHARLRVSVAIMLGALVVPLVLVTGSRAGLVLGVVAVASIFVLYRQPRSIASGKSLMRALNSSFMTVALGVFALTAITIVMARAESIFRFTSPENVEDLRWQAWASIEQIGHGFFPVGAGPGSLARLFQYHESDDMLGSAYLNQAHNDWLDVYLTLGLFGFILAGAAAFYVVRNMLKVYGSRYSEQAEVRLAKLGIAIVSILGLASIVDYPLRTPAGAILFVFGLLWMTPGETVSKSVATKG